MPRRKPYTRVDKIDQTRPAHVVGKGDVVFKGFQCLNPVCQQFIFVPKSAIAPSFSIPCPRCGRQHTDGAETALFSYQLRSVPDGAVLREGDFSVGHFAYISDAQDFKYCLLCYTLKPLDAFDRHASRASGRQGECRLCKAAYNALKNPTRTRDQHRDAAQKRRLYIDLSASEGIESAVVYARFHGKCFKCGAALSDTAEPGRTLPSGVLDHTLPVKYLWPMNTGNATLLCSDHNNQKADKWPSQFYSQPEIRKLVPLTGLPLRLLSGAPQYNPQALARLADSQFVDLLLERHAQHMDEIVRLRNRLLRTTGRDMFAASESISDDWVRTADELLHR